MKNFAFCMVASLALVLSGMTHAQQKRPPALEALIKAAQAEKSLNVVWGPSLGAAVGAPGGVETQVARKITHRK